MNKKILLINKNKIKIKKEFTEEEAFICYKNFLYLLSNKYSTQFDNNEAFSIISYTFVKAFRSYDYKKGKLFISYLGKSCLNDLNCELRNRKNKLNYYNSNIKLISTNEQILGKDGSSTEIEATLENEEELIEDKLIYKDMIKCIYNYLYEDEIYLFKRCILDKTIHRVIADELGCCRAYITHDINRILDIVKFNLKSYDNENYFKIANKKIMKKIKKRIDNMSEIKKMSTETIKNEIKKQYIEGKAIYSIAKNLHKSPNTITEVIKKLKATGEITDRNICKNKIKKETKENSVIAKNSNNEINTPIINKEVLNDDKIKLINYKPLTETNNLNIKNDKLEKQLPSESSNIKKSNLKIKKRILELEGEYESYHVEENKITLLNSGKVFNSKEEIEKARMNMIKQTLEVIDKQFNEIFEAYDMTNF